MAGSTLEGQYTVLNENPPKVPSFIKAPHSTKFAECSTSSCWYKIWFEVYNQSENNGRVRKHSRFSKKVSNVATGEDDQHLDMVDKESKIERDTVCSHEKVNKAEDVDEIKDVITKDSKLVEDNEIDQVMEDQQHEENDNVNKVNANKKRQCQQGKCC